MATTTTTKGTTTMNTKSSTVGYVSEWKKQGDKLVHKYSVAGTRTIVFAAYEPARLMGSHSTLTSHGEIWLGTVQSRDLPAEIDALPFGATRRAACDAWRAGVQALAYDAIVQAYPEAATGVRVHGEIEILA